MGIRYYPLVGITPKRGRCDLRVSKCPLGMSKTPESVPFVQRVLQTLARAASAGVSQTNER